MIKFEKSYNKNIIIKCVILSFIIVIIPVVVFAYRAPASDYCSSLQRRIDITYNDSFDYSFHSTSPEERFKELCVLLDKEYGCYKEPFKYYDKECSYGVIINDSNEPMIYCKYHGNAKNAGNFSRMARNSYYAYEKQWLFFFILIIGFVLSFFIRLIKKLTKYKNNKIKGRNVESSDKKDDFGNENINFKK